MSTWHDVPLYLEGGALSFICEIPKETSAKMEVATVRTPVHAPLKQDALPGLHHAMADPYRSFPAPPIT